MITICGRLRALREMAKNLSDKSAGSMMIDEIELSLHLAKRIDNRLRLYKDTICQDCEVKTDKLRVEQKENNNGDD